MRNQSNIFGQILTGVSITVVSTFLIWKLGISKDQLKDVTISVSFEGFGVDCSGCDDCKLIVMVGNRTQSIHSKTLLGKDFKLSLDQSVNDIDYQIQFIGKYCDEFYNNTYVGKIPAYDSNYRIKIVKTKKEYPLSLSSSALSNSTGESESATSRILNGAVKSESFEERHRLFQQSLKETEEVMKSLQDDIAKIREAATMYKIDKIYLEEK